MAKAPCSNVVMFYDHPLRLLSGGTQSAIRTAVRADVQAIVSDPGMGLEGTKIEDIPLNAIQIGRPTQGSILYAVSWGDRSFGVNGAVWIVEVFAKGAKNLVQSADVKGQDVSRWGFGVEVLAAGGGVYPEVMIASKGFKEGGGAEAEGLCMKKTAAFYEPVACPAACRQDLNARISR
jgi:hypothetical protein